MGLNPRKRLKPKSLRTTALIIALVATGPLSTDMYLPALPQIRTAFFADTAQVQLTLSVFLAGLALAQLILGPLSDRFGRRPVLIGGMALYALASAACVFAPNIEILMAARFVQAIGVCAGGVVGRAVVRDIHGRIDAARMLSHISTAMAVAPLVAPLVGGHLTVSFGWTSIFWTMAAIGVAVCATTLMMLPETNVQPKADALNPRRFATNYKTLLSNTNYRAYLFSTAFSFSGLFAFISGSSFVLIDTLKMAPDHFGFAFGFVVVGFMVGSHLGGRWVKRLGVERLVALGGRMAMGTGTLALALNVIGPVSIFTVIVPMALYLVSVGLILPSSTAGAIAPYPTMAGAASALVGFVQMMMAAAAGALVGRLFDGTPVPMMAVVALCGVLTWVFARQTKAEPTGDDAVAD
jgi:DHA1 family bicyclomycin/chloramphenicol resistance-like MFS transporter